MDKLKPCPFCGGEAKIKENGAEYNYISCKRCKNGTAYGYQDQVIARWNTRAERTCKRVSSAIEVGEVNGHKIAIPEYRCGECNRWLSDADKYCPNCGAKVIGG